jgi:hypothetical protein
VNQPPHRDAVNEEESRERNTDRRQKSGAGG